MHPKLHQKGKFTMLGQMCACVADPDEILQSGAPYCYFPVILLYTQEIIEMSKMTGYFVFPNPRCTLFYYKII